VRKLFVIIFVLLLFLTSFLPTFASSNYVLPYPSAMPGGVSYKLHLVWEKILQYWYFGDFGQFTYNLNESDKYLVEAKTLFEYNQYLLGYKALQKSNDYFVKIAPFLKSAKKNEKNVSEKKVILISASQKHIEVLEKMRDDTPENFYWTPEKSPASLLKIHLLIDGSIQIRSRNFPEK